MKIREIDFEEELYEDKHFFIDVKNFGPGGIYKTIIDIA